MDVRSHSFRFDGQSAPYGVAVQAYVDGVQHFLENFLSPFIRMGPVQHRAKCVYVVRRSERIRIPLESEMIQGFLGKDLYRWTARLRRHWSYPSGFTVIEDGRGLTVLVDSRKEDELKALARLVRELCIDTLISAGALKIKANAFVDWRGRCVLVLGSKGAGKTFLTLRQLLCGGAFIGTREYC